MLKKVLFILSAAALLSNMTSRAQSTLTLPDLDARGGADNTFRTHKGNNPSDRFVPQIDFYEAKSDSSLTILHHFQTAQQTTEWSCGDVSTLLVLNYYGIKGETELSLAKAMHSHVDSDTPNAQPGTAKKLSDFGTSVQEIVGWAEKNPKVKIVSTNIRPTNNLRLLTDTAYVGIKAVGNYEKPFKNYKEASSFILQQLKDNHPIIVNWTEWGGHWVVIIGYDNNGTPDYADDDILIFADPYDTFDRKQDGYTTAPLVQFYYGWIGEYGPKPWQLQPYVVLDKNI